LEGQLFNHAKSWVLKAGEIIRESFEKQIKVEYKTSAADLVTEIDKEIEQFFIKNILENYPGHYILGEEGVSQDQDYDPKKETVWIIDPIDGTTNFVHQKRNFAISVGIYQGGKPKIGFIYDPVEEELFHAERGKGAFLNGVKLDNVNETTLEHALISLNPTWLTPNNRVDYTKFHSVVEVARGTRCIGSASLEMAYIACGRLDAYIDFRLSSWDIAAGLILLDEVGVNRLTVEGHPIDVFNPGTTLFSLPGLSNELIEKIS
jgi:myo-inositol-1(or 4)-monophosphatase